MTQPALERFTSRGMTLKPESTEGTDSVPVAATNGFTLMNGTSGTEFDKVERPIDRAFFTGNPFAVANKRAFIEGDFEIYPPTDPGDASDGITDFDTLLRIAGMARTLTAQGSSQDGITLYTPISTGIISASAYWYHVDALKKVLGARASINQLRMAVGAIAGGNARVQGTYNTVDEVTLPAITLPTFVPVAITAENTVTHVSTLDSGPTVDDLLVWGKELVIAFGSQLGTKEYTSHRKNAITDRKATWTLRMARADLSDFNP